MITLSRACAASDNVVSVITVVGNSEIYQPDARAYQYRHRADLGEYWYYENFPLSVQDVVYFTDHNSSQSYFVLLSAEGDVYHFASPERIQERIVGAGTTADDSKFYGKTLKISQIGNRLYACGAGGQIYVRRGLDNWRMLSDTLLNDPEAKKRLLESGPSLGQSDWKEWIIQKALNPETREVVFYDIKGLSEDAIYVCGTERTRPILCFWDGRELQELNVPLTEAALTNIHIENAESVWICGREGVILHGSRNRGFAPVNADTRLNLFHSITSYRGKLVLPASVRPGGLYELDPSSGEFRRFQPPLPRLSSRDDPASIDNGPFFAQSAGDVLWVVASKDIFRFDGQAWERIKHPDI
ncbi:hypothetical protein FBZ98_107142 [Rhizobium sp. ERR 922]|uniref:hypothetical protein n=1 Tax=unclassified Rhizobium TaxID=2613769 RepID=UPI000DDC348C|nr:MULTISPECIES: hypothetical protein [unclassified Rhizobium]TWB49109.1 hypothetical protein FBZ98_107142 [Rhizobium sp. ERR 922]TWB91641.1 hypothetical protein FBZ97_107142 [Rhizobium sp. ERR 942]